MLIYLKHSKNIKKLFFLKSSRYLSFLLSAMHLSAFSSLSTRELLKTNSIKSKKTSPLQSLTE
jgi:hypothetical protein